VRALRKKTRTGGFTLIELLVVMAIISLLAALIFAVFGSVGDQKGTAMTVATIKGLSMGLETYKTVYGTYPPDRHPQLARSSQALVYYLSGKSIHYDPAASPAGYRWTHDVYDTSAGGAGRKQFKMFYEFDRRLLKDAGGRAPGIVDGWGKWLIYNSGSTPDSDSNRYGAPKHGDGRPDLLSAGSDGVYGTDDDVVSWKDELLWGYDAHNLNDGTH